MAESEDQTTAIVQRHQQSKDDNGTGSCTNPRSDINLPSSVRIRNMSRNYMSYNPHSPQATTFQGIIYYSPIISTEPETIARFTNSVIHSLLKLLQPSHPPFNHLLLFPSLRVLSFLRALSLRLLRFVRTTHSIRSNTIIQLY